MNKYKFGDKVYTERGIARITELDNQGDRIYRVTSDPLETSWWMSEAEIDKYNAEPADEPLDDVERFENTKFATSDFKHD